MGFFARDSTAPRQSSPSLPPERQVRQSEVVVVDGSNSLEAGVELDDTGAEMSPSAPFSATPSSSNFGVVVHDYDFDDDDDDDFDDDDESVIPPPPPPFPPPPTAVIPPPPTTSKSLHALDASVGCEDVDEGVGSGRGRGRGKWMLASIVLGLALIGTGLGVGLGIDWDKGKVDSSSSSSSANAAIDDGDDDDANIANSPTYLPTVESNEPTSSSTSSSTTAAPTSACPATLDATYEIDDGVTLRYAVSNGLFCARIKAKNDGGSWMGLGFSPDGMMDGSVAAIGVPNDGSVLKYQLTSSANVMDGNMQTLAYARLDAGDDDGDGYVTMEFAKLLVEEGEVSIVENAENRMIYAMGDGEVGYHWMRISFVIDLASSVDDDATTDTTSSTVAAASVDDTIYDAIVIGAGWAGIRAIETLYDQGITNVLGLEATNAIGGRCRTLNGNGNINDPNVVDPTDAYDLGSDWLYSGSSRMFDGLSAGGYLDAAIVDGPIDTSIPMGLDAGRFYKLSYNVDDDSVSSVIMDVAASTEMMETIWGGFHEFRDNRIDEMSGMSYEEAIDWYIGRWGYTDDEVIDFLDFMGASVELENAGDSSLLDINEISFFPPGYAVDSYYMGMPGEGFGNVAARYAAPHASSIRLNSRVIEVDSDAESDITVVTYVNEDGETMIVKAKTVLVTVSLGVLKAGTINFVPALPENKVSSIEAMGFGLINKCILSWEDDAALVWPRDEMWFMLITPDEEASGRWTTFFNPSSLKGRPTLTSFVAGNDAIAMEGQTDEEVVADVMTNLRAMFPDIPDPDGVIVTRWGLDKDFLGAHSFPVPGRVIADDSAALSESYGRIYFAGEATDAWWGTTLGAWNSGEDQALAMAQKLLGA